MQNTDFENTALINIFNTLISNREIISKSPSLLFAAHEIESLIPKYIKFNYERVLDERTKNFVENNQFFLLLSKIVDALNNFGVMTENSELLALVSISKNLFLKKNEKALMQKARLILEVAEQYLFTLETFGVKRFLLAKFALELNNMERQVYENEEKIKEKANYVLCKIDILMENLKTDYPKFYNEYQINRHVTLSSLVKEKFENISFG